MHSCVLVRLKPFRRKDEGQLGLKSSVIELPGGGAAQNTEDTKNAAYKLVCGVVKNPRAQQSTVLIETCAEMCRTEGVNFAKVLQDPVFEGCRVLYCIIVSRPPRDQYGLLSAILDHSGPLSSKAIDEVHLACIKVGDQALFSNLWRHPAYHALSGTDELLLGGTSPRDYVEVEDPPSTYSFSVRFEISQFHKRMSTSGRIVLEFIARGLSLATRRWSGTP